MALKLTADALATILYFTQKENDHQVTNFTGGHFLKKFLLFS